MLTYVQSSHYTLRKGGYTGVSNTNTTSSEITECEPRMQDTNVTSSLFTCESGAEPEQSDPEEDDGEAGSAFTWNTETKTLTTTQHTQFWF